MRARMGKCWMSEQAQIIEENADSEQRAIMMVALVVWLIGVAAGLKVMLDTSLPVAAAASVGSSWPAGTHLVRSQGMQSLVMFANPREACSRDDVDGLAQWMAHQSVHVNAQLVWVAVAGSHSAAGEGSALWHRAANIPGVALALDEGAVEASHFGAHTSGQTWLYDGDGRLLFAGPVSALPDNVETLRSGQPVTAAQSAGVACRLADAP